MQVKNLHSYKILNSLKALQIKNGLNTRETCLALAELEVMSWDCESTDCVNYCTDPYACKDCIWDDRYESRSNYTKKGD